MGVTPSRIPHLERQVEGHQEERIGTQMQNNGHTEAIWWQLHEHTAECID